MDTALASQIVTATATLAGVILTLTANAFLERRRARDTRALEEVKLAAERAKWLREAKQRAYAEMSNAGENALQFIRVDLRNIVTADRTAVREAEARWIELRIQIRVAFNQVALFGTPDARERALTMWRTARNTGNDFFAARRGTSTAAPPTEETLRAAASALGTAGDQFLEACRVDLGSA